MLNLHFNADADLLLYFANECKSDLIRWSPRETSAVQEEVKVKGNG